MADTLLDTFKDQIASLTIIPAGGGVFEVAVNGVLVHSKDATGRFPEEAEITEAVARAAGA